MQSANRHISRAAIAATLVGATSVCLLPAHAVASTLSEKRAKAEVLSSDIAAYTAKIDSISQPLNQAQARFNKVQSNYRAELSVLVSIQSDLRAKHKRQAFLTAKLNRGRKIVAARLVALYKSGGSVDVISVILNSRGFAELIENEEFLRRITVQDKDTINGLKESKAELDALTKQVAAQEVKQAAVTADLKASRDEINRTRLPLLRQHQAYESARSAKSRLLDQTRESISELEKDAAKMHADEAGIASTINQSATFSGGPGIVRLSWPVNGPVTSPYGPRVLNGTSGFHPGVDIGASEGTPITAAADGVVVLMQGTGSSGGFGNFTCVQHTSTMSTCYAHQSRFGTFVGAHVRRGQVIGYVGNTGFSFGSHLDLEVRINGSPVNPLNYM